MNGRRTVTTFKLMGTLAVLCIPGEVDEAVTNAVRRELRSLEARLTVNGPPAARIRSQVGAINAAAGYSAVAVDADVYELVRMAVLASRRHKGSFNALIGPVVKAWNIGFDGARVPSRGELAELLPLTDPEAVTLDDEARSVRLHRPGMELDLGAVAKGYAADRAAEVCRSRGIRRGLLDLGGNVLAMGESDSSADGYWRVGIQSPFHPRGAVLGFLRLQNASAVTSGVYERVFETGGRRYHHMIDPETGYPFDSDLASVTVVADRSADADLWATILQRGGLEGGLAAAEEASGIEAVFVTTDRRIAASSGLRDRLTPTMTDFRPDDDSGSPLTA